MKQYEISVIITVYNRTDELKLTLDSLINQKLEKERFEVVIADDGSSEDIVALLEDYPMLNITYSWQEDQGFRVAAARNLGINNAKGKILVFNDNGILFSTDTLQKHVSLHKDRDDLVLLGYMYGTDWQADTDKIRDILDNNAVDASIAILHENGNMGDGRENYLAKAGQDMSKWFIPWLGLWGGHFSVSAQFIEDNNISFDEQFTSWGGEDNEFGIQLCNNGANYHLNRDVKVVHYPTVNRANNDIKSDDFKENYKKVKKYITDKHNDDEKVQLWGIIGGGANDPIYREEHRQSLAEDNHE